MAALDLAMENPVLGAGVGTIYEMPEGPHNMFLAMMVEYGIVGLIVYRRHDLQADTDRSAAQIADLSGMILFFVAWLVIFGFASHNLLENTETIPLMGFALGRAYQIQCLRKARQVEAMRSQEMNPCGS